MHANCCEGRRGGSPNKYSPARTRRYTGDKYTICVDGILRCDVINHSSEKGGFAAVAHLVLTDKPVPTPGEVISAGLLWIEHQEVVFIVQDIEARTRGKVIKVLRTAVQSHEQRDIGTGRIIAWNIKLIGP